MLENQSTGIGSLLTAIGSHLAWMCCSCASVDRGVDFHIPKASGRLTQQAWSQPGIEVSTRWKVSKAAVALQVWDLDTVQKICPAAGEAPAIPYGALPSNDNSSLANCISQMGNLSMAWNRSEQTHFACIFP